MMRHVEEVQLDGVATCMREAFEIFVDNLCQNSA